MEFDNRQWIDLKVEIYERDLLNVFLRTQSLKTINRHGIKKKKCNLHDNEDYSIDLNHTIGVEYRKCASSSCHMIGWSIHL
jgi:hypothetical protein